MIDNRSLPPVPVWLRFAAVFTVLAALPLVLLGAEVTTKKVGMADSQGFRAPWHLFVVSWRENGGLGFVIEHSHRVAGFVVGSCCIVLALGLTFAARGWFYRMLGWLALVAVGSQGLLGIFRVDLNATLGGQLALIHGLCAQLVIGVLITVAVLCSRTWSMSDRLAPGRVRIHALLVCGLVYLQIAFGAITRHLLDGVAQRVHVLLAFVVLGAVFGLISSVRKTGIEKVVWRWCMVLAVLVCIQPIFGVEAWIQRFGSGMLPELVESSPGRDFVRTGHHLLGTLIFATTVAISALTCRPGVHGVADNRSEEELVEMPKARALEGVA